MQLNPTLLQQAKRSIARKIREAREERGLTASHLATVIGTTQQTITNWETAKHAPGYDAVILLSTALGKPIEWFYAEWGERRELGEAVESVRTALLYPTPSEAPMVAEPRAECRTPPQETAAILSRIGKLEKLIETCGEEIAALKKLISEAGEGE